MKIPGIMLSMCIALVLVGFGCSKDDSVPDSRQPEQKAVVRKAIPRPKPQPHQPVQPAQKPEPGKIAQVNPSEKTEPEKPAPVQPKPPQPEPMKPQKPQQPVQPVKTEEGVYVIQERVTLPQVAAKKEVYGDLLKWPILFLTNRNVLSTMGVEEDPFDKELPTGTRLKIITPKRAEETLKKMDKDLWAINVISVTTNEDIVPSAMKLIENRYPTYITRTNVKGVDYMRLRVGFFKTKEGATAEGRNIVSILRIQGVWPAKVGEQELSEFGGYLGVIEK
ncbi:MAG: hypothetical protein JW932_20615 [Deltaproteobacteria bacterium]|nr:hypothetical protein [Deltaproteobacteria bacterium]